MNKKEEFPTKIVTFEAQETLLKIATEKNDFDLLGAIKDVNLIASEFKKHKSCYKFYTSSVKNNSEPSYEKVNFEAVCNVIEDQVIFKSKSFSIYALLNLYRENIDDLKQYRYYLKKRIECKFGEKIMFLSPGYHKPDIVVGKASTETSSLPQ